MLDHNLNFNRFKKMDIQSIFSDYNVMKLEIKNKRKGGKFTNLWKLNKILLKNQNVKEEITRQIRKYLDIKKSKTQLIKTYGK